MACQCLFFKIRHFFDIIIHFPSFQSVITCHFHSHASKEKCLVCNTLHAECVLLSNLFLLTRVHILRIAFFITTDKGHLRILLLHIHKCPSSLILRCQGQLDKNPLASKLASDFISIRPWHHIIYNYLFSDSNCSIFICTKVAMISTVLSTPTLLLLIHISYAAASPHLFFE